ncbi:MAG TPA: gliding motility-associated protein GldE [Adhaeribacter sp.]|nr:gliding motility-associated protein GldE [Adhaeribacter sp.]
MEPGDPFSCLLATNFLFGHPAAQVSLFILIPILLLFSALISGAEKAFFSIPEDLLQQYRHSPSKAERRVFELLEDPRRTLATIFFTKAIVNILFITLGLLAFWHFSHRTPFNDTLTFLWTSLLFFLLLFPADVLPKVYYTHHPTHLAVRMAPFLKFFQAISVPVAGLLLALEAAVNKKYNIRSGQSAMEDLQEALDASFTEESTQEEKAILKGIVNFSSLSVRQIMVSRQDITAYDYSLSMADLIPLIVEWNYSRVPVFRENIDNIEGILYVKDLLPYLDEPDFKWQDLLRPPYFVPESKKIDSLLKDFQEMRVHLAVVVDEYGGTSGLLTLEDIIEEIVGDIKDEFDDEDELVYSQVDENTYIFDAKTSLHNFCKITGASYEQLEEVKGENESLAGLMLELFAKIPRTGARTSFERYEFVIEDADSKKVKTVRVHVKQDETLAPD